MGYRDVFDRDLRKKGEDIINGIESESNIASILLFLKGYQIVLDTSRYSSNQLRQILENLKQGKDIDNQDSNSKIFINKNSIIGYHVKYQTKYKKHYHKEI